LAENFKGPHCLIIGVCPQNRLLFEIAALDLREKPKSCGPPAGFSKITEHFPKLGWFCEMPLKKRPKVRFFL
jgi:hypothetical protein